MASRYEQLKALLVDEADGKAKLRKWLDTFAEIESGANLAHKLRRVGAAFREPDAMSDLGEGIAVACAAIFEAAADQTGQPLQPGKLLAVVQEAGELMYDALQQWEQEQAEGSER